MLPNTFTIFCFSSPNLSTVKSTIPHLKRELWHLQQDMSAPTWGPRDRKFLTVGKEENSAHANHFTRSRLKARTWRVLTKLLLFSCYPKNVKPPLNFALVLLLGSLRDASSSCRSLSRQFQLKAPASGCQSDFYKGFLCRFILRDITLSSDSKKNNIGRVVHLVHGWSKQDPLSCTIPDFVELHWQTGLMLWTEKENAVEQCEHAWEISKDTKSSKILQRWDKSREESHKLLCKKDLKDRTAFPSWLGKT